METMEIQSKVHSLKTFVNSRLSAAVEEIIGAFENTLSVYEEEIVRQRRLLECLLKPEIKLQRICVPQEEILLHPERCHTKTSTSVDQDVPEPPMIKEEENEFCTSQEDEHFELETEEEGIFLHLDLFRPETSTSVDQDVPEPPMIKEEVKELCTSQEDEHFELETEGAPQEGILLRLHPETSTNVDQDVLEPSMIKQEEDEHFELETEALKLSPTHDKSESGEEQLQIMDLDQTGSASEEEPLSSSPERLVPSKSDRKTLQVLVLRGDYSQYVETIGEQFECTVCGEVFSVYADLNLHKKMHADNKRYQCKFCKKEFTASSSVSRHHRVHTGEKPYECDLCGKRFNINSALKIHYRIHTGEKPYKCKTCGKSFTTSSNRKQHSILHTKPARSGMKNVSESRSEEV